MMDMKFAKVAAVFIIAISYFSFIPNSSAFILSPKRPAFAGLHIGMSEDSANLIMQRISLRRDTLHVDSLTLLESDSVQIFGQPAYIQLQIANHRVRTIIINWHPLGGD